METQIETPKHEIIETEKEFLKRMLKEISEFIKEGK